MKAATASTNPTACRDNDPFHFVGKEGGKNGPKLILWMWIKMFFFFFLNEATEAFLCFQLSSEKLRGTKHVLHEFQCNSEGKRGL